MPWPDSEVETIGPDFVISVSDKIIVKEEFINEDDEIFGGYEERNWKTMEETKFGDLEYRKLLNWDRDDIPLPPLNYSCGDKSNTVAKSDLVSNFSEENLFSEFPALPTEASLSMNDPELYENQELSFTCANCEKTFMKIENFNDHSCYYIHRRYRANKFGKKRFKRNGFKCDSITNSSEKPYVCAYCFKCFPQRRLLKSHLRTHTGEKPFSCEECHKRFSQKCDLKIHYRIHTGEKPFPCNQCEKKFMRKDHLKHHLLYHSGEKPIPCEFCGKRFRQKSTLNVHLLTHSNKKKFSCNYCPKKFNQKHCLTAHVLKHFGDKPFSCEHCTKKYVSKPHLTSHVLKHHSNIKPFACYQCDEAFALKRDLSLHLLVHKGKQTFLCAYCNKEFRSKAHLKSHLKTHSTNDANVFESDQLSEEIQLVC